MTSDQYKLIQDSWMEVKEIQDQAAELFYNKLFELDPDVHKLFKTEMKEQGTRLMQMIDIAVGKLDNLTELVPFVEKLGERYHSYGVQDKDYETVANALIWTLGQGLGAAFTREVKQAWVVVYSLLAETMKKAISKAA